jgi:nucleoside-diphosphate-sugar epimerase
MGGSGFPGAHCIVRALEEGFQVRTTVPEYEDELIVPAREGTLRALRAASQAGGVKRVVITLIFAAVG